MKKSQRSVVALAFASSVALAAPAALAQSSTDKAKMLFNAGAAAYSAGQFNAAIQAFDEANRLLPKPQIGFSLAQAHRRQYFVDKNGEHLRVAVKLFQDYLAQVPEGGRRGDAAQALGELEPLLARAGGEPSAPASMSASKDPTRLMVLASPEDAAVEIDGKAAKAGMAVDVTPGKHHVKVSAPGYFPDEKDVAALEHALRPVDVALKEKPARLVIEGPSGATVTIDGRPSGETPLLVPIEVPAGTHLVVITKNGHRAFSQDVEVGRDELKKIPVDLKASGQRTAAWGFFIGGAAALVTGGVFTAVMFKNQGDASSILDKRGDGSLTPDDLAAYDRARDRRDGWAAASAVAFGVGGAAIATGLVLYLFDAPQVTLPARAPEERKKPTTPAGPKEPIEMSFTPLFAPGMSGAGVVGRF
jgi:tetratricopeptide (TPR) repeat protein